MKRLAVASILAAALAAPSPAQQDLKRPANRHSAAPEAHVQAEALADGEVRKVDKEAKRLIIKHGPIPSLDMPAMTMVFRVKEPGMLDQVKAGDKVKFRAEKLGGAYTVTSIEVAN